jgi:sulfite exporter TauE/SafE
MDLIVPFITGLTTGGLSCLAVQGGLLASSIAHEVEQSVRDQPTKARKAQPKDAARLAANHAVQTQPKARTRAQKAGGPPANSTELRHMAVRLERNTDTLHAHAARPIILFLVAKLIAYTVLGFFLGLLGSVLQLSAMTRAVLQAAIGVFMVGTALRMFKVHPIFRYFALEPPSFVTRYIRRKAKGEASEVTPLFLGALTVLIPCGVTQAMMAVAMGTGSAVAGATTMFAFILGTSPVFFVVAYLATRLGSRLEASFMRLVAIVVLVLGLISVDAGLTLAGWPYSFSNLRLALASTAPEQSQVQDVSLAQNEVVYGQGKYLGPPSPGNGTTETGATSSGSATIVTINVANRGYTPRQLHARPNQPLQLALVTNNTGGCARAFVVPALGIQKVLPTTGTTTIDVPAQKPGSKLYFSCSMGMYSGVIIFDA